MLLISGIIFVLKKGIINMWLVVLCTICMLAPRPQPQITHPHLVKFTGVDVAYEYIVQYSHSMLLLLFFFMLRLRMMCGTRMMYEKRKTLKASPICLSADYKCWLSTRRIVLYECVCTNGWLVKTRHVLFTASYNTEWLCSVRVCVCVLCILLLWLGLQLQLVTSTLCC